MKYLKEKTTQVCPVIIVNHLYLSLNHKSKFLSYYISDSCSGHIFFDQTVWSILVSWMQEVEVYTVFIKG